MKKYTFYVSGTSCNGCKMFIEDTLNSLPGIVNTHVDIQAGIATFNGEGLDDGQVLIALNKSVEGKRYVFSDTEIVEEKKNNADIWKSIVIGSMLLSFFFMLQKSGILNFGIGGTTTTTTSFLVGIIASLSSCLAIVGGLVLSLSAKVVKDGKNNKKPIVLFHVGRVFGFAVLGGVLGLVGGVIGISFVFSGILGIVASVVMIMLGAHLLGIFKGALPTLPSSVFRIFKHVEHETYTPLLIGLGTFFLPCGFTQSMQISALSSGSFVSGSLIMFSFALGTLPVLLLISFGSMSFAQSKYASLFFKSSGVIVIGLGIFSLISGLAGLGIISPLFTL